MGLLVGSLLVLLLLWSLLINLGLLLRMIDLFLPCHQMHNFIILFDIVTQFLFIFQNTCFVN